jgi:hypothetical protein
VIIGAAVALLLVLKPWNDDQLALNTTTTATPSLTTVPARPSHETTPYTTVASDPAGDGVASDIYPTTTGSLRDLSPTWPEAIIASPSDSQAFTAHTQDASGQWYISVTLEGQGRDREDGSFHGATRVSITGTGTKNGVASPTAPRYAVEDAWARMCHARTVGELYANAIGCVVEGVA